MSTRPITRRQTDIKAWLRGRPEVEAVLPGGRADTQIGRRADRGRRDCPITPPIATTGRCCNRRDNAWTRLRPGDACFVSEQLARRLNLAIGDQIEVPTSGSNWPLQIVGIYADYGNPKGQVAVNFAALIAALPGNPADAVGRCASRRRKSRADRSIAGKFRRSTAATSLDQATMKAESTRIFNRTFAVTAALNAFTLGVAGIALLTSLLTLSNSRLPQLAPLWAIGITRRRLAAIELLKTMSVALITSSARAAAGPAGGVVPDRGGQCQGVRLAAAVSSLPAAIAGAARRRHGRGALAALLPVIRLARMQPASLIRIFANER